VSSSATTVTWTCATSADWYVVAAVILLFETALHHDEFMLTTRNTQQAHARLLGQGLCTAHYRLGSACHRSCYRHASRFGDGQPSDPQQRQLGPPHSTDFSHHRCFEPGSCPYGVGFAV
jgi:hypothetical protein